MLSELNPQLPYYLMLYALTLILRFIRAYKLRPIGEATKEERSRYIARYFFFGFELVNVSAGVFILLSEHATKFVGTVMMLYVILVILSFFFEDENIGLRLKTIGHIAVSVVVVAVTLYAFMYVDGLVPAEAKVAGTNAHDPKTWKVALPYIDQTLNRNFAVRESVIRSVYVAVVPAKDRNGALAEARKIFNSNEGPHPFVSKAERSPMNLVLLESDAVVEPVQP